MPEWRVFGSRGHIAHIVTYARWDFWRVSPLKMCDQGVPHSNDDLGIKSRAPKCKRCLAIEAKEKERC